MTVFDLCQHRNKEVDEHKSDNPHHVTCKFQRYSHQEIFYWAVARVGEVCSNYLSPRRPRSDGRRRRYFCFCGTWWIWSCHEGSKFQRDFFCLESREGSSDVNWSFRLLWTIRRRERTSSLPHHFLMGPNLGFRLLVATWSRKLALSAGTLRRPFVPFTPSTSFGEFTAMLESRIWSAPQTVMNSDFQNFQLEIR